MDSRTVLYRLLMGFFLVHFSMYIPLYHSSSVTSSTAHTIRLSNHQPNVAITVLALENIITFCLCHLYEVLGKLESTI